MVKLTEKQERFCQEWMLDPNTTQAYMRAGYSVKSPKAAAVEGHKLLKNPNIQKRIAELKAAAAKDFEITRNDIIRRYLRYVDQDIRKYYNEDGTLKPIHELDDDAAAALAGVETDELFEMQGKKKVFTGYSRKIKRWDAVRALEGLVKVLGFNAPVKFEGEIKAPPPDMSKLSKEELRQFIALSKKLNAI